jgi:hypothetical protein
MTIHAVPIVKGGATINVDSKAFNDEVYNAIFAAGLKKYLNDGMSKITVKGLEGDQLAAAQAAAMEVANKKLETMSGENGRVKAVRGAKAGKVSGKVMTEARRIARALVKEHMKAAKLKVSHYKASEITKAADTLIAANPALIEQAKAAIEAQDKQAEAVTLDISAIPVDKDKVAKAEKDAAAKKTLSATQAGKVAQRVKPQANA